MFTGQIFTQAQAAYFMEDQYKSNTSTYSTSKLATINNLPGQVSKPSYYLGMADMYYYFQNTWYFNDDYSMYGNYNGNRLITKPIRYKLEVEPLFDFLDSLYYGVQRYIYGVGSGDPGQYTAINEFEGLCSDLSEFNPLGSGGDLGDTNMIWAIFYDCECMMHGDWTAPSGEEYTTSKRYFSNTLSSYSNSESMDQWLAKVDYCIHYPINFMKHYIQLMKYFKQAYDKSISVGSDVMKGLFGWGSDGDDFSSLFNNISSVQLYDDLCNNIFCYYIIRVIKEEGHAYGDGSGAFDVVRTDVTSEFFQKQNNNILYPQGFLSYDSGGMVNSVCTHSSYYTDVPLRPLENNTYKLDIMDGCFINMNGDQFQYPFIDMEEMYVTSNVWYNSPSNSILSKQMWEGRNINAAIPNTYYSHRPVTRTITQGVPEHAYSYDNTLPCDCMSVWTPKHIFGDYFQQINYTSGGYTLKQDFVFCPHPHQAYNSSVSGGTTTKTFSDYGSDYNFYRTLEQYFNGGTNSFKGMWHIPLIVDITIDGMGSSSAPAYSEYWNQLKAIHMTYEDTYLVCMDYGSTKEFTTGEKKDSGTSNPETGGIVFHMTYKDSYGRIYDAYSDRVNLYANPYFYNITIGGGNAPSQYNAYNNRYVQYLGFNLTDSGGVPYSSGMNAGYRYYGSQFFMNVVGHPNQVDQLVEKGSTSSDLRAKVWFNGHLLKGNGIIMPITNQYHTDIILKIYAQNQSATSSTHKYDLRLKKEFYFNSKIYSCQHQLRVENYSSENFPSGTGFWIKQVQIGSTTYSPHALHVPNFNWQTYESSYYSYKPAYIITVGGNIYVISIAWTYHYYGPIGSIYADTYVESEDFMNQVDILDPGIAPKYYTPECFTTSGSNTLLNY